MFNKLTRSAAAGAMIIAAALAGAPANAAAPDTAPTVRTAGTFCVLQLPDGKSACVEREADMPYARKALGLPVNGDYTQTAARGALATWHLGTFYDDANYGTGSGYLEVTVTTGDCTASKTDSNYQNQNLADNGWAARISSFKSYGNCQTRLYSTAYFGGSAYPASGYSGNVPYVGAAMNDQARSVKWT